MKHNIFFLHNYLTNRRFEENSLRSNSNLRYFKPEVQQKKNRKREQILEGNSKIEKYTEIERENRILLEKIHRIQGKNINSIPQKNKKSLNISQRIKKLNQISIENKNIYKNLKNKKSYYDFSNLDTERNQSDLVQYYKKESQVDVPYLSQSVSIERPRKLSPLIIELKKIVYKKKTLLDNRLFSIEICKGQHNIRMIACDSKSGDNYCLELN